jgi:hypothetical protein
VQRVFSQAKSWVFALERPCRSESFISKVVESPAGLVGRRLILAPLLGVNGDGLDEVTAA